MDSRRRGICGERRVFGLPIPSRVVESYGKPDGMEDAYPCNDGT
jgi:hypothetical protein